MYNKEDILYPIFLKCCTLCKENNFWSTIFEDLSKGITPYGTYISKDYLCCSYKSKEFSYYIIDKTDVETVYKDIKHLLKNKLGLTSLNEKLEQFKSMQNNKTENIDWASVRKKNAKNLFIDKFVIKKSKEYNLSIKKARELIKLIYYFNLIRTINQKDIIFENGEITEIKGISFSDKKIHVDILITTKVFTETTQKVIPNTMRTNWQKYIKEIHKLSQSIA